MINIVKSLEEADYITHAGNFHADDVFANVFLEKLYNDIKLIRLKEYTDDGSKLAYDIGMGKFDHHQRRYDKKRENGVHYCSFGLLWQEYGKEYLKKIKVEDIDNTFKVFDYLLVNMIDAFDNGEFSIESNFNVYTISTLIELFRPKYDEHKDENECFLDAINFARIIFDLIMKEAISKVKVIKVIQEKVSTINDRILILDEFIPYEFAILELGLDIDFVVYPSNRGGYAAHTVPTHYKGFNPKVPFKKEWAGLRDYELQKVSGVKTSRFCHNKLFLVTADTLEDTIKLVYLSK